MTQHPSKYSLPAGYRENPVRTTMDSESGGTYWNAFRLNNTRFYQYAVYTYARDVLRKHGLKSLIDVGCGPGMKLRMIHEALPDVAITGIDQPHPIEFCKQNHGFGEWFADDFENPAPALSSLKASVVMCSDVIEHVLDPDKLLSYIAGKLETGGYVILSTPDRDRHYGAGFMQSGHKDHIREWNKAEFANYLEKSGWTILEHFHTPGIKAGLSRAYLNDLFYHFTKSRPKHMDYNQVVLLQKH